VIGQLTFLHQDIVQGKGIAVSNGSFKDSNGVAAWIIKGSSGTNQLQGTCLTPRAPDNHSAFQSKLTGLYGILLTLRYLFPNNDLSTSIIIVCDGQLALTWAKAMDPLLPSEPHYDLILAIQQLVNQMLFTIQWRHVQGHQDGKTVTTLPRDVWLKIEVDIVAKAAAEELRSNSPPLKYDIPFSTWVCYVVPKCMVKQFSHKICTHLNSPALEKYWKEKQALSQHQWALTDWESLDWVYMESPTGTRRWATKNASGHFSHGKNMVQWCFHTNLACPWCQALVEDKLHVITCPLALSHGINNG